MGCSQSAYDGGFRKSVDENKSPMPTRDEIDVIQSDFAWLQANADVHAMVERILQQMFIIEPSSRTAFLSYGQLNGAELIAHPNFQALVRSFQRALADIVNTVGDLEALIEYLHHLGVAHRAFSTMRYEHIDAIEAAMGAVFESELSRRYDAAKQQSRDPCHKRARLANEKVRSQTAWRRLFHMMSYTLYDGYRGID
jgi:Globin